MAIFIMILRKMAKNRWLELGLLVGLVLTVALASSMPVYINAILQRMLIKDLERVQSESSVYPGTFQASIYLGSDKDPENLGARLLQADRYIEEQGKNGFGAPVLEKTLVRTSAFVNFVPTDAAKIDPNVQRNGDLAAVQGMENHIRLVDGRLPAKEKTADGYYEALVTESALTRLKMVIGNEFAVKLKNDDTGVKVRAVGVIDKKAYDDIFWPGELSKFDYSFIIPFDLYEKDFTQAQAVPVKGTWWHYALDYSKFKLEHVQGFLDTYQNVLSYVSFSSTIKAPAAKIMESYFDKEKRLRLLVWSLNVPVLLLLAFYLYMVSNLIVDRQKNEIAVLRSRGAGRLQIIASYAVEGLVLGTIAFLLGPYVSMLLAKVLGASSGFLEFVQRAALDVRLNAQAWQYAASAVFVSIVMTLIPVFQATRNSIVTHKAQLSRVQRKTFWHKFYLDVVLIAVSLYGLRSFHQRMNDLMSNGLDTLAFGVDPLLFLIPALFTLGTGLFILRLYPWFLRLVYWSGKRFWPPAVYSALIQVGRSASQYQFIMVFLILTMATGLFSASAARTINKNAEDRIRYTYGADIVMQTRWENDAPPPMMGGPGPQPEPKADEPVVKKRVQYSEPPFQPIAGLNGVQDAAKVFVRENAWFGDQKSTASATLMGIETDDFGSVAWMRNGLLDHHMNEYLNLLAADPSAVLISRSIAEEHGVKPGDRINLGWDGVEPAEFSVYGVVDYWPGWNPNPVMTGDAGESGDGKNPNVRYPKLVVGHLSFIQNNLALEPYKVWLKLKPDTETKTFYKAVEDSKLQVETLTNSRQMITDQRKDPFLLAINGAMTLGFMISVSITMFGFLLYWVLSLSARTLQMGILRAMGISFRQLVGMLACEQLLTSAAAIVIGMLTGTAAGRLFVPVFKVAFNPTEQVPPFQVTFNPGDQLQLYAIACGMIAIGLAILGYMLSRIKIHQAVKLGED